MNNMDSYVEDHYSQEIEDIVINLIDSDSYFTVESMEEEEKVQQVIDDFNLEYFDETPKQGMLNPKCYSIFYHSNPYNE